MSRQYSVAEVKNQLPALVHEVEHGSSIEITRRGKPVAVILSMTEYRRLRGEHPDLWSAIQRFRAAHDLEMLDMESAMQGLRSGSSGREFQW